jgi:hypothetical protein
MQQYTPTFIAQKIETTVRDVLHLKRVAFNGLDGEAEIADSIKTMYPGDGYTVTVFKLYTLIQRDAKRSGYSVTAHFFNRVLADMKRVGVIGTAKGGEVAFLSDAAFEQNEKERQRVRLTLQNVADGAQ